MPVPIAYSQYLCAGGTIISVWQLIYRNTKLVVYKVIATQGLWQNMLIGVKSNKIGNKKDWKKTYIHREQKQCKTGTIIKKENDIFYHGSCSFPQVL